MCCDAGGVGWFVEFELGPRKPVMRIRFENCFLVVTMLLLGGCVAWAETFYRPTADSGHPHCGTNWVFNNPNVDVEMNVFAKEKIGLSIWFNPYFNPSKVNEVVSTNLQDIRIESGTQTYNPQVIEDITLKESCPSWYCKPDVNSRVSHGNESFRSAHFVAWFPQDSVRLQTFTVFFPPLLIQGAQVNLAPVTFTKTFEFIFCH